MPKLPVVRHSVREFFQDARGTFNAFTLIALLAGVTLVTAPLVCRLLGWDMLGQLEVWALTLLYCIAALGDAMLAIFLNKMPSTVVQRTEGGDANLAAGAGATAGDAPPGEGAAVN